MPNLICRDVSFAYPGGEHAVFTHLDLIIDTAWRTALVGGNGRGKTTLLKLLAGQLAPDRGEIERPVACQLFSEPAAGGSSGTAREAARRLAGPFARLEAEIEALLDRGDEPALARYGELESEYRALGGYGIDARLDRELEALGVRQRLQDRPLSSLSGGEQTRTLLAGLFAAPAAFVLIDEPTNHLDRDGRALLAEYLAGKSGFLMVSHDRNLLDAAAEHLIALNPDTVEHHRLRFSHWREVVAIRLAAQAQANADLKKDIRRLESAAVARREGAMARERDKTAGGRRRLPSERISDRGFVGAQAARQMKRALAAEQRAQHAVAERRETLTDVEKVYALKLADPPEPPARGGPLVRARDCCVIRDRPLFEPVSFEVRPGERVALLGPNGSGKTSLLDTVAGEAANFTGELFVPKRLVISRVRQLPRWRSGLLRGLLEEACLDEGEFRQIMAALGVRGDVLEAPLERLSQGQLKKVELARAIGEAAHLLLWDEPLNYVDVDTRERIEAALIATRTTMLFVEHDARFVERLATSSVTLTPMREDSGRRGHD
ncbi:MAG: ATP-binding cassette domain-containing protein [Pseudomonadales bacterium]